MNDERLKTYRRRAFELLTDRLSPDKPEIIDYQIDSCLRRLLDLPARPDGDEPYQGWMVGKTPVNTGKQITSQKGINLIKRFEGLRTAAYKCPAGVWTIGYGHTQTAKPGMVITPLEAEELLKKDLFVYEQAVRQYVKVPLSQNQFDALVSFTFNVGMGAFKSSTLLRLLNQGDSYQAGFQFMRWTMANGKRLPGLVRRREAEQVLFETT